jgi:hypothetical protein
LLYGLELGPTTEKTILDQCLKEGLPLPARIANAPELLPGLELYYVGFLDLTTCRGQGYGTEGPISWSSINEYCIANEIEGEQREDFFYHIQQMDAEYLDFKTSKLKASLKVT